VVIGRERGSMDVDVDMKVVDIKSTKKAKSRSS
jgi:hypothetical protein